MQSLFHPQSVAVIGASSDPTRIGGQPIRYMKESGYAGQIYPVNPKHASVQGLPAYPSIADIAEPVDLAIIAVPRPAVLDAMEACVANGTRAVVVFSAGFAEVGDVEGRRAQQRIAEIARPSGMRVLGPNCGGRFSVRDGMFAIFTQTFEHGMPMPGHMAIVMQSGAMATHCFVLARERGIGLSFLATTGNECDVDFADCLAFFAEDETTNVILAGMEGCRDREKLVAALALAQARRKPVIMLKVGGSEVGAKAARSHSAALAGPDEIYDTVFRQYGVLRAKTIDELLDIACACTANVIPARGPNDAGRVGLVTLSGGGGGSAYSWPTPRIRSAWRCPSCRHRRRPA